MDIEGRTNVARTVILKTIDRLFSVLPSAVFPGFSVFGVDDVVAVTEPGVVLASGVRVESGDAISVGICVELGVVVRSGVSDVGTGTCGVVSAVASVVGISVKPVEFLNVFQVNEFLDKTKANWIILSV